MIKMFEDEESHDAGKISQPFAFGTQAQAALEEWSIEDERKEKISSLRKKFSFHHKKPVAMSVSTGIGSKRKRLSDDLEKGVPNKKQKGSKRTKSKVVRKKRVTKNRKIGSISSKMSKKYNRRSVDAPMGIGMLSGKKGKLRNFCKGLKGKSEDDIELNGTSSLYTEEEWNDALTQIKKRFSKTSDALQRESLDSLTQKYKERHPDLHFENASVSSEGIVNNITGTFEFSSQKEPKRLWPKSSGAPTSLSREDIKMLYDYDSDGNGRSFLSESQSDDDKEIFSIDQVVNTHGNKSDGFVSTLSQVMDDVSKADHVQKPQEIDNDDLITISDSCSELDATQINLENIESPQKDDGQVKVCDAKNDDAQNDIPNNSIGIIGTQERPLLLSSSPKVSENASENAQSNFVEDSSKKELISHARLVRRKVSPSNFPNVTLLRRSSTEMSATPDIKKLKSINQLPESIDTVSEIPNSLSSENSDDLICVGYNDLNVTDTPMFDAAEDKINGGNGGVNALPSSCQNMEEVDVSTNVIQVVSSQKEPIVDDNDASVSSSNEDSEPSTAIFASAREQFENAQDKFTQQVAHDSPDLLETKDLKNVLAPTEIPDSQFETQEKQNMVLFEKFTTKQLRNQISEWGLKPTRSRSSMLSLIQMTCNLMDQTILKRAIANFDPSKSEILKFTQAEKMPEIQSIKEKEIVRTNVFNKIRDCLVEGNDMYQKILMYKPLDINKVMKYLHSCGLRDLDTDVVCDCLDELGICFSDANNRRLQKKAKSK